jgi:YD repeat-containing protein
MVAGRLVGVEDDRGGHVEFTYDASNRLLSRKDQLGRTEYRVYGVTGRDSVWTNRRGQTVTYVHDARGRLVEKHSDVTSHYAYDGENALTRAWNTASDVQYFRDALGRDTATTQLIGGVTRRIGYGYVPGTWLRSTMRDPEGGVHTYAYDAEHRLLTITDPESQVTTYGYDLTGRILSRLQGNGQQTVYGYAAGRIAFVEVNDGASVLWSVDQTLDGRGNPNGWALNDGNTWSFSHDLTGQLTHAELQDAAQNPLYSSGFWYDGAQNRTDGGAYHSGVFDAANRVASAQTAVGTTTWTHDLDGNMTAEQARPLRAGRLRRRRQPHGALHARPRHRRAGLRPPRRRDLLLRPGHARLGRPHGRRQPPPREPAGQIMPT